jgi:hypothetical protein
MRSVAGGLHQPGACQKPHGDRRKNSRSGRRAADPHTNWRRLAWLFAAYAAFLSLRSLPLAMKNSVLDRVRAAVQKLFRREPIQPA